MYNGYFGKVLRIDVSNKTFCEELIDSKLYRILMGGSCLAAYFLIIIKCSSVCSAFEEVMSMGSRS